MAKKSRYGVVFIGHTGKREEIEVDADNMSMMDGIDDSMVCFTRRNKTVFALPFRSLVHATEKPVIEAVLNVRQIRK